MLMRTRLLAALALIALPAFPAASRAQNADRDAVLATVQKVFDAMRTRDTALLLSAFDTTGRMVNFTRAGGVAMMLPSRFGAAFASAPAGNVWNERMYDPEVRIDGNIAQVWGYYTFFLNNTFSHCGVDAFMLAKTGGAWKITQIADSRRTEGCTHTTP
jgi:hypothetical protein